MVYVTLHYMESSISELHLYVQVSGSVDMFFFIFGIG